MVQNRRNIMPLLLSLVLTIFFFTATSMAAETAGPAGSGSSSRKIKVIPPQNYSRDTVIVTAVIADIFTLNDNSDLQLISRCKKGDRFPILATRGKLYKINAWGRIGYIHSRDILHKDATIAATAKRASVSALYYDHPVISWAILLTVVILLLIVIISLRVRALRSKRLHCRSALHLSEFPEEVRMLNEKGKKISLKKFLQSRNTLLVQLESTLMLRKHMARHMPDIILVDWRISSSVADILRKHLKNYRLSAATTVIFYHVEDTDTKLSKEGFGDADVFLFGHEPNQKRLIEIVSGVARTGSKGESKQEANSYLSGIIHGNNFEEVLQMIDSGRKNGCLVVEDEDPFGVIFFKDGQIIYAATRKGILGLHAIYAMLNMKDGSFYFKLDRKPPKEELSLSVMAVLMEWSAQEDYHRMVTGQYPAVPAAESV